VNKQVPQRAAIGISVNGVYLFGALEGGGGNAVDGSSGITVLCSGHPQPSGNWHYHNPSVACKEAATDELVGWALDGFPIYGATAGSKEDADAVLDECNGRDVDDSYGYKYHVRTREQVDETLTDNAGPNNTENWKYFLGCYKGETAVTEDDAEDIDFTEACVDGKSTQILGIDSSTAKTATVSLVTEGPETTPSSPYKQATTTTASSEGCN
jgi:YHYH protein